jgi:hypothetical protein
MSIAIVSHISRDQVHIQPEKGYMVAIFTVGSGSDIEATVLAEDGSETVRLKIDAPPPGRKVRIRNNDDGSFDVIYQDIEDPNA